MSYDVLVDFQSDERPRIYKEAKSFGIFKSFFWIETAEEIVAFYPEVTLARVSVKKSKSDSPEEEKG